MSHGDDDEILSMQPIHDCERERTREQLLSIPIANDWPSIGRADDVSQLAFDGLLETCDESHAIVLGTVPIDCSLQIAFRRGVPAYGHRHGSARAEDPLTHFVPGRRNDVTTFQLGPAPLGFVVPGRENVWIGRELADQPSRKFLAILFGEGHDAVHQVFGFVAHRPSICHGIVMQPT
jgi:hypothetical protein